MRAEKDRQSQFFKFKENINKYISKKSPKTDIIIAREDAMSAATASIDAAKAEGNYNETLESMHKQMLIACDVFCITIKRCWDQFCKLSEIYLTYAEKNVALPLNAADAE